MARRQAGSDSRLAGVKRTVWVGIAAGVGLLLLAMFGIWWDAPRVDAPDLEPAPRPFAPEAENGAVLFEQLDFTEHPKLHQAIALTERISNAGSAPSWDPALAAEILALSTPLLDAVDACLARPAFRLPEHALDEALPHFYFFYLARLILTVQAWDRFQSGDHLGACDSALKLAALGHRIMDDDGSPGAWASGFHCKYQAAATLAHLAGATERREVLARILDERARWKQTRTTQTAGLCRALKTEFFQVRAYIERVGRKGLASATLTTRPSLIESAVFAKPNATVALHAEALREALANAAAPPLQWTFPFAEKLARYPERLIDQMNLNSAGWHFASEWAPIYRMLVEQSVNLRIAEAFAVLTAALRLHEMDHGALPETLDALVPAYFDELPSDPYNDGPLAYDPAGRLVWSVGDDFIDAGGQTEFPCCGSAWRKEPTLIVAKPREGH